MGAGLAFSVAELAELRSNFEILGRTISGKQLVYLDSANTSQKPREVIDAVAEHYREHNANVSREMHQLGAEATAAFEQARGKVADFLAAERREEIVFTKNASEALNLCAHTLGASLMPGDEIVVSVMEHHSNLVPWQLLCQRSGARLRWFDITESGQLDLAKAEDEKLINERTKIVSLAFVSNVLGTVNPVSEVARLAHQVGAVLVVDASQAVGHQRVSVADLGADFLVFTGHKVCGPTGIGVLWGRYELLEQLPPFLAGGEMIEIVRLSGSTFAKPPHRFEAGTPPIAQAVGLGAACDFLTRVGLDRIRAHEDALNEYALARLAEVSGLRLLGSWNPAERGAIWSFVLEGIHPHDVMQVLDANAIAVRGGHHCARPLHEYLGVQSSVRASAYLYTTIAEIDELISGLVSVNKFFRKGSR